MSKTQVPERLWWRIHRNGVHCYDSAAMFDTVAEAKADLKRALRRDRRNWPDYRWTGEVMGA